MVQFCPKCGKELNDDDIFCDECGVNLKELKEDNSISANNIKSEDKSKVNFSISKKTILVIVAIIAALVVVYGCASFLYGGLGIGLPFMSSVEVTGAYTEDSWTQQTNSYLESQGYDTYTDYDEVIVIECVAKNDLVHIVTHDELNNMSNYTYPPTNDTMGIINGVVTFSDGTKASTNTLLGDVVLMNIQKGASFTMRTQVKTDGKTPTHIKGNIAELSDGKIIGDFDVDIK